MKATKKQRKSERLLQLIRGGEPMTGSQKLQLVKVMTHRKINFQFILCAKIVFFCDTTKKKGTKKLAVIPTANFKNKLLKN